MGKQLAMAAERLARERGIHTLYLLTTTAADLLLEAGLPAHRARQGSDASQTAQFGELCPASSSFMANTWPRRLPARNNRTDREDKKLYSVLFLARQLARFDPRRSDHERPVR